MTEQSREQRFNRRGPDGIDLLLVVLLVSGLAACGGGEDEGAGAPAPSVPVDVVLAERDTVSVVVPSVGGLEANARVRVAAEISGRVTEINFEEGGEVREGDVLVRIGDQELEASLEAAEATLERMRSEAENLQRQVERNEELLERGAISQQAYDDLRTRHESARAGLREAEAQVRLARERLEDATVRAPFDGRVGERDVDRGAYVAPGDPLFLVVDDDPLEIEFSVPERYVGRLELGDPVALTVRSREDTTFRGRVTYMSPVVDPVNRTLKLKARVANPGGALRAGQFADVELDIETRPDALMVPEAALVPRQEGAEVFLVRDGRAHPVTVTTGVRQPGRVQLLSGVEPGDSVVVAGQQRLQEGTPVTARAAAGTPAVESPTADTPSADTTGEG